MTRLWLLLGVIALASACARSSGTGAAIPREVPDSTRGRLLAAATKSGASRARLETGMQRMQVPADLIIAGHSGSAIVAGLVRPDGRMERATRTVVFMDGHAGFAKAICDLLLTARFAPKPPDSRGAIAFMPISFNNAGMRPPGSPPTPPDTSAPVARRMRAAQPMIDRQLDGMTEAEMAQWFAGHPHCAKVR
jgi:hypothetical protein